MVSTSWPSKESTVVWSGGKSDRRDTRPALSILRLHVQLPMIVANRFLRLACQGVLDVMRGGLRIRKSLRPTAYAICAHNQTINQKLSQTDVRTGNWTLTQNHGLERDVVVGDAYVGVIGRVGGSALVVAGAG